MEGEITGKVKQERETSDTDQCQCSEDLVQQSIFLQCYHNIAQSLMPATVIS